MPGIEFTEPVFAFLATYALHSTICLSLAWVGIRLCRTLCCEHQLTVLRAAMITGVLSSVVQFSSAVPGFGYQLSVPETTSTVLPGSTDGVRLRTAEELGMSTAGLSQRPHQVWRVVAVVAVSLWLASIVFHMQHVARDWWRIDRLRRTGREVTSESLSRLNADVARELGLRRSVQLLVVHGRQTPIVSGFLRPVILIGEDALADLDEGQTRALLAHEQAHVRRFDPLWNLVIEVFRGMFSFQPLNHWAANEIRVQSEFAADRSARSIHDPLDLARCLQNFAERHVNGRAAGVLAIGMAGPQSKFAQRVHRLLDANDAIAPNRRTAWAIRIAGIGIVFGLGVTGPGISKGTTPSVQHAQAVAASDSTATEVGVPSAAAGFVGVVEGVLVEKIDRESCLFEVFSVEELARDRNEAADPSAIIGHQIHLQLIQSEHFWRHRRRLGTAVPGDALRISIRHSGQDQFDLLSVRAPKSKQSPNSNLAE